MPGSRTNKFRRADRAELLMPAPEQEAVGDGQRQFVLRDVWTATQAYPTHRFDQFPSYENKDERCHRSWGNIIEGADKLSDPRNPRFEGR